MKRGDVVTMAFPQADKQIKLRPAVLMKEVPPFGDWIVCPVSTKLHREVPGLDVVVRTGHPEFASMGLKRDSIIRVAKIQSAPKEEIQGLIGSMSEAAFGDLVRRFVQWFQE
jgi:mRNA interferase MazF